MFDWSAGAGRLWQDLLLESNLPKQETLVRRQAKLASGRILQQIKTDKTKLIYLQEQPVKTSAGHPYT
jgi:hypothetical protein